MNFEDLDIKKLIYGTTIFIGKIKLDLKTHVIDCFY